MKDELKQYGQDAIRTESLIEEVRLNPVFFSSVLQVAIAAGNMLDQMKKHAFYGKDYNSQGIMSDFASMVDGMDGIKNSFNELNTNETGFEIDPRVFHSILGIATESTELLEAVDIYGQKMDNVNILEECFDIDWYQFILVDALDGDLQQIWDTGIAKLRKRYPEKFTSENAINRDVDAEREILDVLADNPIIDDIKT